MQNNTNGYQNRSTYCRTVFLAEKNKKILTNSLCIIYISKKFWYNKQNDMEW